MMSSLLPLLVAVPLLTAGALVVLGDRPRAQAAVLLGVLAASTASGVALAVHFRDGGALAHGVGLWPVGVAIPFVADMFSALMLIVTGLLSLTCTGFALASGLAASRYYAPLLLVLTAGVNGALLTGDLFNLFVFVEVMLLPSYGLFILAGRGRGRIAQVAGARLYVTINLLTSTIFLGGVGFVYGTAGTVNIAELAGLAREDGAVAISAAVCLFALGIKAAVVPVHGWLARAYPSTSPAITALFSGLHTKVAIYAIYRIYAVLFEGEARYLWVGVAVFCATMALGVLGAVGEGTSRSILAFHMVSQIGYILLGVALFTELGLTAGIFYLLHHMIVKASLFLSTGAVEVRYGTDRLGSFSGVLRREPLVAAAFFVAALSLAGIPPFSGFVAKLSLIAASVESGQVAAVVVMILVSLVTLLSMLKIWSGMFWGAPRGRDAAVSPAGQDDTAAPGHDTLAPGHDTLASGHDDAPASGPAPSTGDPGSAHAAGDADPGPAVPRDGRLPGARRRRGVPGRGRSPRGGRARRARHPPGARHAGPGPGRRAAAGSLRHGGRGAPRPHALHRGGDRLMTWLSWPFRLLGFAAWYAGQLVTSNASVIADNLTPGQNSTPGIARMETRCRSELEVTLLAALITLTPGTLTMGTEVVGRRRTRVLYVHGLYSPDADRLRADLGEMERRMLRAVRRKGVAS
ncbi:proton-conducting transporter transmembrane domain-containing protein [Rothia santali]